MHDFFCLASLLYLTIKIIHFKSRGNSSLKFAFGQQASKSIILTFYFFFFLNKCTHIQLFIHLSTYYPCPHSPESMQIGQFTLI